MITHFKNKQPQKNSMINVSSLTTLLRQTVSHCHQYILTIAADNKNTQLHQRHQYRTCPSIQPNLQHTLIIMVSHHTNTQNNHKQQHQLLISPTTTSKRTLHANNNATTMLSQHTYTSPKEHAEKLLYTNCRKLGLPYQSPADNETAIQRKRRRLRLNRSIASQMTKFNIEDINSLPDCAPLTNDPHYNKAMECIRAFELQQMAYQFQSCSICNECKLQMKMSSTAACSRCAKDNKTDVGTPSNPRPL